MARIGLVAGEGKLPIVFADFARQKGDTVIAFGLKGITDEKLAGSVAKMHWLEWGALQKGLMLLVAERIGNIILLGKLKKEKFFKESSGMDDSARKILDKTKDKKDYVILNEVAKALSKVGVKIVDPCLYLSEIIPKKGVLTKKEPSESEWEDINYGRLVAKSLSGFDVGQTIAVKDKTVVAVEAMEGTDETIKRAGDLVGKEFSVVKVARPNQDMRFDVPLVGPDTMKAMISSGGSVLALEADKTLLMDAEEVIKLADENKISLVVI
jgi:hypothetical protein